MCDDHSGVLIHIPGASMVRSDGTPRPNGRMRGIDACIAPLVKVLNGAGIGTVASCCGHGDQPGNIALADGRELVIMADFDSARALDAWLSETGPDATAHLLDDIHLTEDDFTYAVCSCGYRTVPVDEDIWVDELMAHAVRAAVPWLSDYTEEE